MTYDKTKQTTEIITKIGIIARKNRRVFVEFSDTIMVVNSFICFDVIFLEKMRAVRLPSQKKRYLLRSF